MCTTTDSGSDGSKAALVISVTSERFSSRRCEPASPRIHLRMTLVVGTDTIAPAKRLNAYFPGSIGSDHTPRCPGATISPCEYAVPDRSAPLPPTYDTTTPTVPTSI